jgi:menaquinone-dependent protoporphyrinogen IX oxidase
MRVCVLYGESGKETICKDIASGLAEGIGTQGHNVDIIDMRLEPGKIVSFYEYVVVGTASTTFWGGKIPEHVTTFLKQSSGLSGKRCFAFVAKHGIRLGKTLQVLMHAMESQGMYLKYSDIISNKAYAKEVGKRLIIS